MKPEIIHGMTDEEYHASTGMGEGKYISRSMIGKYIKDPCLFKYTYLDLLPFLQQEENDGMKFGNYVEDYLLNQDTSAWVNKPVDCWNQPKTAKVGSIKPWTVRSGNYVLDENNMPTSETTAEWEARQTKFIDPKQVELAEFLKIRFAETKIGAWWLSTIEQSKKQVVVRWQDADTGLPLQIKLDNWLNDYKHADFNYISDLKSTASSIEKWNGTAAVYMYDLQHVMYTEGVEVATNTRYPFFNAVGETMGLKRARIKAIHDLQLKSIAKKYRAALHGISKGLFDSEDKEQGRPSINELKAWELYEYESET